MSPSWCVTWRWVSVEVGPNTQAPLYMIGATFNDWLFGFFFFEQNPSYKMSLQLWYFKCCNNKSQSKLCRSQFVKLYGVVWHEVISVTSFNLGSHSPPPPPKKKSVSTRVFIIDENELFEPKIRISMKSKQTPTSRLSPYRGVWSYIGLHIVSGGGIEFVSVKPCSPNYCTLHFPYIGLVCSFLLSPSCVFAYNV